MLDMDTLVAAILVGIVIFFSLDFDKYYGEGIHDAARHPFARFIAGLLIVFFASYNPVLALLALTAVFFWIADVNLLSSFSI